MYICVFQPHLVYSLVLGKNCGCRKYLYNWVDATSYLHDLLSDFFKCHWVNAFTLSLFSSSSLSLSTTQLNGCPHFLCFFFITRGQFWPLGIVIACVCVSVRVSVCVYQSLACPHDNSSAVHARITKFGWETQNTLVKMPIIFGGDRPWPSRSNLTWKWNFTSFWVCPHDNFSLV